MQYKLHTEYSQQTIVHLCKADSLEPTWCPHIRLCDASIMAFIPEAQTLLIVVASVESSKPNITQQHSHLQPSTSKVFQVKVGISIHDTFPMISNHLLNMGH